MAMECVGSVVGPACVGQARDWWGEGALFAVCEVAVVLVLAAWVTVRLAGWRRGAAAAGAESERRQAA
jgi:hypothetical protein